MKALSLTLSILTLATAFSNVAFASQEVLPKAKDTFKSFWSEANDGTWVLKKTNEFLVNSQQANEALASAIELLKSNSFNKQQNAINISDTHVTDVTPLRDLPSLVSLNADNTKIIDLTPLSSIASLKELHIAATPVQDLTPIRKLTLEYLNINHTNVKNITPLRGMQSLKMLVIKNTEVTNFKPLVGLKNLNVLYMDKAQITDLTFLNEMQSLQRLSVRGTEIKEEHEHILQELKNKGVEIIGNSRIITETPPAKKETSPK